MTEKRLKETGQVFDERSMTGFMRKLVSPYLAGVRGAARRGALEIAGGNFGGKRLSPDVRKNQRPEQNAPVFLKNKAVRKLKALT